MLRPPFNRYVGTNWALRGRTRKDPLIAALEKINADGESAGLYYFDPNICDCFQDTAGTTPAVVAGDPVARIDDYFGNGWSMQQGTVGLQPVLEVIDGLKYVKHETKVLTLASDPALDMGDTGSGEGVQYGFALQDFVAANTNATYTYMGGDDTGINNNRVLLRREYDFAGSFDIKSYSPISPTNYVAQFKPAAPLATKVLRCRNKFDLPTKGITLWEDGVLMNTQANNNSGSYDLNALHIGQRDGDTERHPGFRWSAFFFVERVNCNDESVELLETALVTRN